MPSAAPAASHPPEAGRLRPRGSSQGGLRQYNERVVLQAIRLNGALPAAEIARLTQLTAQTVSQITKRLLDDGLLVKGTPLRGKVGQPSVPLALAPDGAYAIGVKVGRRSLDVLLVDFTGAACQRSSVSYDYPEPEAVCAAIDQHLQGMREWLGPGRRERLQGIGIAAPLSLGGWQTLLGVDSERARAWDRIDLPDRVAGMSGLPVTFVKDTAAACVAELVAGRGRSVRSFLYVFVDTFIGGGLVLDSHLRGGLSGNAGAVGSLAMGRGRRGEAHPPQLLSIASLFTLETLYAAAGLDLGATTDARALQPPWRACTDAWLAEAGPAIALALHDAACLLDLEGVIVDGQFSRELLAALLEAVEAACADLSWEGVRRPLLMPGTIGPDARALGGALLPLHANFAPDRDLFLKLERPL
ncbi:MAG: ROK family protein [Aquincola tertiaricarbonis]|uniref:ROK family transcriptional regulator n=1 Tax=Aquincola TaxID=391952 RepID=UPI000614CCDD|nr:MULTISPECIES: ROK family transcriptional regulator [Aquincola]MCR5866832.1 ROK family transcriptional regulator [Aquincola sp. J276]